MKLELNNFARIGDNLFAIKYCNKVIKENPNISEIEFFSNIKTHYPHDNFHNEILECSNDIRFKINNNYENRGLDTWIGSQIYGGSFGANLHANNHRYSEFFLWFYQQISNKLNIENPFKTKEDLFFNHDSIVQQEEIYDYCIVNSYPRSGQYSFNQYQWDSFVVEMDKKYKLFVLRDLQGLRNATCADRSKMSLMEIARESTKAKQFIAISTGPFHVIMNTINKNKKMFVYENEVNFDFDNCVYMRNGNPRDIL